MFLFMVKSFKDLFACNVYILASKLGFALRVDNPSHTPLHFLSTPIHLNNNNSSITSHNINFSKYNNKLITFYIFSCFLELVCRTKT